MPKKRHDKALLIKPGSQVVRASPSRQNESTPSVNDLIRESRKLQFKNEPTASTPLTASVPPHLRDVLNLPVPQAPAPRAGIRSVGPLRQRRIPGPPPPRSWLVDSRHASASEPTVDYHGQRIQTKHSTLPADSFPEEGSLLHMTLKELATSWEWHAEFDGSYLAMLPTSIKQSLLSYIAVYAEGVRLNPLRLLLLLEDDVDSRREVTRLDLTGGVGMWTSLRQLKNDLANHDPSPAMRTPILPELSTFIPASWDEDAEERISSIQPTISPSGIIFKNLKHLSLALSPGSSASWKDLIRLTSEIATIASLSLAYWPQPTYTPRAAVTRTIIRPASNMPGTVYGGSNVYTAMDNDWREAAGILRSLSRMLYCLRWLDLTGCGDWYDALVWQPERGTAGPEWNGSWRGVEHICLSVGWKPVPPVVDEVVSGVGASEGWDVHVERQRYYHSKELERHGKISRSAEAVVQHLRSLRKSAGGKWIDFDL